MSRQSNFSRTITTIMIGWIAALSSTLLLSFAWTAIFPGILLPERYYGEGPGFPTIVSIVLLFVTPAALIGALVGGRVAIEGGSLGQRTIAVIFAIVLATPCGCYGLWFFTGY